LCLTVDSAYLEYYLLLFLPHRTANPSWKEFPHSKKNLVLSYLCFFIIFLSPLHEITPYSHSFLPLTHCAANRYKSLASQRLSAGVSKVTAGWILPHLYLLWGGASF
jgi:hypothetical protein